jgi:hypothetical protein
VCAASIIRATMMEAVRTSETSVDIQLRTRQYIPEDSELQINESAMSEAYSMHGGGGGVRSVYRILIRKLQAKDVL